MASLGRKPGAAALTSADIPDGSVTAAKVTADVATQAEIDLKSNIASPTFTGTPAVPTAAAATNTTQAASTAYVRTEVTNLVDSAPAALDTLNELAAALGDDAAFSTTVTNSIALKAPIASPTFTGNFTSVGIDDNAVGAVAITIDADERVGIGVSPPSDMLDGYTNIAFGGNSTMQTNNSATTGASFYISQNAYRDNVPNWRRISETDEASQYVQNNGTHKFNYVAAGTIASAITWLEAMRIGADGNVGIGTDAPGVRTEIRGVQGAPATSGTTQTGIFRISSPTNSNVLDFGQYGSPTYGMWIQGTQSDSLSTEFPIVLQPNGGNVGVGTAAPLCNLHVESTEPYFMLKDSNASSNVKSVRFSSNAGKLYIDGVNDGYTGVTAPNIIVAQLSNGHVGIGDAGPAQLLSLYKDGTDASAYVKIDRVQGGGETGVLFYEANNLVGAAVMNNADGLELRAGGNSTRMAINAAGNVGIAFLANPGTDVNNNSFTTDPAALTIQKTGGTHTAGNYAFGKLAMSIPHGGYEMLWTDSGNTSGATFRWYFSVGNNPDSYTQSLSRTQGNDWIGTFNGSSDRCLKKNIETLDVSALDLINTMRPVTFEWNEKKCPDQTGDIASTGFIAQELLEIIPEGVVSGDEWDEGEEGGGYALNSLGLIAYLAKGMQELSAKVTALENA